MKKLFLLFALALFTAQFSQAQWEPDVRLTIEPSSSLNPSHCIASSGDSVHVVWYDDRDGNNEIYYKSSIDGGVTWGADIRLTNQFGNSTSATLALSGLEVYVAWNDDREGVSEIYYKRSTDGGNNWGEDTRLTNTPGLSYSPVISVSGALIHIIYIDKSDGWWNVYYKRSTDGGLTWDTAVQLTNVAESSLNPRFCTTGQVLHVVWDDYRDGNQEIYYKRSTDNGITWEEDTRLTYDLSISWLPCVGASGSDVYIVWTDERDGNSEIYFKHSTDGGLNWGEDYRLTNNWGESWYPNLAVSVTGIFVVWADDSDGNREIYYKCSTDGGINWEPDIRLTDDPGESKYSHISIYGSQINVVWTDYRDGNYEIYYKRDPTGGFPVGIENELPRNSNQAITVYPNPASTILNINFSSLSDENITLRFMDISGKTFRTYNFKAVEGVNQYTINLDDFRDGVYFIGLTDGINRTFRKVIIKR